MITQQTTERDQFASPDQAPATTARAMSGLDLYERAAETFDRYVHQVARDQWDAPTPCEEWSVRDLVNHVAAENRWMSPLLAGLTVAEVGSELDGDLLGEDPLPAWSAALAVGREASTHKRDGAQTVRVSFGEVSPEEYLRQVGADHLLHAWDLARAIGADDRLDRELVDVVAGWFADHEPGYREANAVGPRPPVANDADPQERLLAMFGRSQPAQDALAAVDRFGLAFDAQDVDGVMAAMTEDCVFESTSPPDGVRYQGQRDVRAAWTQFFADSAGAAFRLERRFGCGDRVVVHWRYDWAGEHPGHVRGVDVFRIESGLVAEKVSYVKG